MFCPSNTVLDSNLCNITDFLAPSFGHYLIYALCESFYVTSLLTRTLVPIHKQFGMYFFENIQVNYLQFGMARESTLQNATQRVNLRHRMPHSA